MIPADDVRSTTAQVLSDPAYAELRPGPGERILETVRGWVAQLLAEVLGSAGAGAVAQLVVLVLLAALVAVGVVALRRMSRRGGVVAVDEALGDLDAATLARRADEAAADGDHETAVRTRYAALVRTLEDRGVVEARPGTTVGEVDAAVRRGLPAASGLVEPAGRALADVVYGAGVATGQDDRTVARAFDAVTPDRTATR